MQIRFLLCLFALVAPNLSADKLTDNSKTNSSIQVIGVLRTVKPREGDTLLDIARRNKIGQNEILLANPGVDRWVLDPKREIVLPNRYILPDSQHSGLVLNLPEMRLYYFSGQHDAESGTTSVAVHSYAVSIGRVDWSTPLGTTTVVRKKKDPSWTPPMSIRLEAQSRGRTLPAVVPAGPDNPLGEYALYLGLPGYLIHGTNRTLGIGMRVSHGCIRMYPEDIKRLYASVPLGTSVQIVDQPVKFGWLDGNLYMEVHPPLIDSKITNAELLELAVQGLHRALRGTNHEIHSSLVRQTVNQQSGIPVMLSQK